MTKPDFKQTWPPETLKRFGACVKNVVETWKREQHGSSAAGEEESCGFNQEFIEWIAWFVTEAAADELDDNLDNFPELM